MPVGPECTRHVHNLEKCKLFSYLCFIVVKFIRGDWCFWLAASWHVLLAWGIAYEDVIKRCREQWARRTLQGCYNMSRVALGFYSYGMICGLPRRPCLMVSCLALIDGSARAGSPKYLSTAYRLSTRAHSLTNV